MRSYYKIFIFISILVNTLLSYGKSIGRENEIKFDKQKIELLNKKNKIKITVEVARTEQEHARGLMFREKLAKDEGMLFVFENESIREFWMKNTLIDLDIGYFDKNNKLIDIQQMKAVTSIMQTDLPTYPSKKPAQYALEMTKGWFKKNKIEEGAQFKFLANFHPVKNVISK